MTDSRAMAARATKMTVLPWEPSLGVPRSGVGGDSNHLRIKSAPHLPRLRCNDPFLADLIRGRRLDFALSSSSSFSAASPSSSSSSPEAEKLSSLTIFTCDGLPVQFNDLWDQDSGMAVVAFLRHFGCFFCWEFAASLRDAKPTLDASGVKLITIGVGTPDKAQILAEKLPFPKEALYADPERKAYKALGLYYGLGRTFFNPASAKIIGRLDSVQKALKDYTLEATPNDGASVLQQGGMYVFKGRQLIFARKDEATGDHASLDDVLKLCCSTAAVV